MPDDPQTLPNLQKGIESLKKELQSRDEALRQSQEEIRVLQEQLHQQAIHDALTGVFNRSYLIEALGKEAARAERNNQPLSLVMFDVDDFETVIVQHGHQTSDLLLKALVDSIQVCIRRGDWLCRYGSQEFAVLMPAISLEIARQRAEEWRRVVASLEVTLSGQPLSTTISLGVACSRDTGLSVDGVINAARQALRQAQAAGGNRSHTWQPG